MDTLSKMFISSSPSKNGKNGQYGGLASTKKMSKILPNTRNKIFKLLRDTSYATPAIKRIQSYSLPQNMSHKGQINIRKSPSPRKNNDFDDLVSSMKGLNINKSNKYKKSKSPTPFNTEDVNDLVNMFGKVKIQQGIKKPVQKKTNTKSQSKLESKSKSKLKQNDDDILSNLFQKKMKFGNKKIKHHQQSQQPLRRSSRTIKAPERYTDKPNERKSQKNQLKQTQNKRNPMQMQLSPVLEERVKQKKQRKNG